MTARFMCVALTALSMLLPAAGWGQTEHKMFLQVEKIGTKDDSVKKKEAASLNVRKDAMNPGMTWVSRPTDVEFIYACQTIEADIRNGGEMRDPCELQVLFFVENQETGETELQQNYKEKLELQPGAVVNKRVTSPKSRYSRQIMMVDGEKKKIGSKPYGYMVVLADTKGPFKWSGSPELTRVLRTADEITAVIKDKKLTPKTP